MYTFWDVIFAGVILITSHINFITLFFIKKIHKKGDAVNLLKKIVLSNFIFGIVFSFIIFYLIFIKWEFDIISNILFYTLGLLYLWKNWNLFIFIYKHKK